MFNWYRNAAACLAYLSDVESIADFAKSRWFTRGWTLQELLAPKAVCFYSSDWKCIGDKEALVETISGITKIPRDVLMDVECMWFTSIQRRMSWAAERRTTRVEDIAYCLIGLFGVNMPLLYGEGERAFLRLQEEIIKISDDQSIFVWETDEQRQSALAEKPADFILPYQIASTLSSDVSDAPYTMTHKGLSIRLPMYKTENFYGSQPVYFGILNCHPENDFSRQSVITLCATDTPDTKTFVRCKYRSVYKGTIPVESVQEAEVRSIYIQNHSRAFYKLQPGLIVQVSGNCLDKLGYRIAPAKVRGMVVSWTASTNTARIERTGNAFSHDIATSFAFHKRESSEGFIVVVYFPHKVSTSTELGGIRLVPKPQDWPFDDWLQKTLNDLSSNNIQETCATPDNSCVLIPQRNDLLGQRYRATLRSDDILNQTVYTLHVRLEDQGYLIPAARPLPGDESRASVDSPISWSRVALACSPPPLPRVVHNSPKAKDSGKSSGVIRK